MENLERPITRWKRQDRPLSRAHYQPDRPKSRRGASFQEEIERTRIRPPSSVPKTYNTYIGTGTAIFQPDKIPMGLQPQSRRVTQSRLSTGKVVRSQPERMVRDKKYYEGMLHLKINNLMQEHAQLVNEMEHSVKDISSHQYLKTMVKDLASNLTDLQGQLADHNLALQKLNIGSDAVKTLAEARELTAINNSEEKALEMLFSDRIRRQEASNEIQSQLAKEIYKTDQMIANMNPSMKEQYTKYIKLNSEMQQNADELNSKIDSIRKALSLLCDQVYISPPKVEMFENEMKLWDLQNKKESLLLEINEPINPQEEYESLLNKIKQDNAQLLTMEKTINELTEQLLNTEAELNQIDEKKIDEGRHAKYLEMRKKEKTIDEFLYSVENHKEDELNNLGALDAQIHPLLKKLSNKLTALPTSADYKSLLISSLNQDVKSDLLNTVKSVSNELRNLYIVLKKVDLMRTKTEDDVTRFKEQIKTMTDQIESYSNTTVLESNLSKRRELLLAEKKSLTKRIPVNREAKKVATSSFYDIQKNLSDSELHAQLLFVEKKLFKIIQSNYSIKEYLEDAKNEEHVEEHRNKAVTSVRKLNKTFMINSSD